ncbi:hypothetical protein [Tuanshanicoccus lijuaniae]|uniref:hypothetical protein n=1 Tax=Aerococcaceae bacterium zg-1292 TaxID=2774330 RepID=UPI0040630927
MAPYLGLFKHTFPFFDVTIVTSDSIFFNPFSRCCDNLNGFETGESLAQQKVICKVRSSTFYYSLIMLRLCVWYCMIKAQIKQKERTSYKEVRHFMSLDVNKEELTILGIPFDNFSDFDTV